MASTINASTSSGLVATADTSGVLQLQTGGTAAVTVDANRNVGVGTTPTAGWEAGTTMQFLGENTYGRYGYTRGAYWDGSNYRAIGTSATGQLQISGGQFLFRQAAASTAGTAITLDTSMALDASGNLLVGTTSAGGGSNVKGTTINTVGQIAVERDGGIAGVFNRFTSDGSIVIFRRSATQVGSIDVTTTATAYVTSSDYRLKNSVAPMQNALAKVAALKPVTYKWNANDCDGEGFIAHELAEVCPHAVSGEKDAVDEEGNPQYQGIDTSFLVATLTAAIQEQQAIIQSLTDRVAQLEAK